MSTQYSFHGLRPAYNRAPSSPLDNLHTDEWDFAPAKSRGHSDSEMALKNVSLVKQFGQYWGNAPGSEQAKQLALRVYLSGALAVLSVITQEGMSEEDTATALEGMMEETQQVFPAFVGQD